LHSSMAGSNNNTTHGVQISPTVSNNVANVFQSSGAF
jgi:hypothetical protein